MSSFLCLACSSTYHCADDDGMATALRKISTHIGNLKKFLKASALLSQLFTEGKLSGAHGDLVFQVYVTSDQRFDKVNVYHLSTSLTGTLLLRQEAAWFGIVQYYFAIYLALRGSYITSSACFCLVSVLRRSVISLMKIQCKLARQRPSTALLRSLITCQSFVLCSA